MKLKTKRFSLLQLLLAVLLAVVLTALAAVGLWNLWMRPEYRTLLSGFDLVNERFVGEHESADLLDSTMSGLIQGTGDRWSYYLDPERRERELTSRKNEYVGVGIAVDHRPEEGLRILAVEPGSPAEEQGLKAGEYLVAVDGASLTGEDKAKNEGLLQGEAGTSVTLTVLGADGRTRDVTLTRKVIESVPVSYRMLEDSVGYIQIENYYKRSGEGVEKAVQDLSAQGARALIFDVRDNRGGYLDELVKMLDLLLPEQPVLKVRTYQGEETVHQSDAACVDLPMVVLVNEDSYSAAEMFAGELREAGAAQIVGAPTSGKGYSQQLFALPNGGAVGLSTAEYFTGEGVSLIGTGLTLDREVVLTEQEEADREMGLLPPAGDRQLRTALELLH